MSEYGAETLPKHTIVQAFPSLLLLMTSEKIYLLPLLQSDSHVYSKIAKIITLKCYFIYVTPVQVKTNVVNRRLIGSMSLLDFFPCYMEVLREMKHQ